MLLWAVASAVKAHAVLLLVAVMAVWSAGHRKCYVVALVSWERIYALGSLACALAQESLGEASAEVDCSD